MPRKGNRFFFWSTQTRHHLRFLFAAASLLAIQAPALATTPFSLTVSPQESNDGVARLTWEVSGNQSVHIQQSRTENFREPVMLYQGNDTGTTITGLKDGSYFFRIGTDNNGDIDWGEPKQLQVAHHSLTRAFGFFAIGVVVFLATLALIVTGSRRQKGSN
jgi:uncharacterized protein (DUF2141 family)